MKLAIMQPYFFPYIGYFSLIANTDRFVFFDTPQYTPRSWMNRNRIIRLNGDKGFTYITVPVKKAPQKTAIKDIYLAEPSCWTERFFAQLSVYKKLAPYYDTVIRLLKDITDKPQERLAQLNIYSITRLCEYLDIPLNSDIFSEMDLEIGDVGAPDEWGLKISKALKCSTYINAPGGLNFFDRQKFEAEGVDIQFLRADFVPYFQQQGRFESGLSIIDVMMYNGKDEIKAMLEKYTLL